MTSREILLSVSCLSVGLLIGSWKGDDVVESLCGVNGEIVSLPTPKEEHDLVAVYSPRVIHYLVDGRPARTLDMSFATMINRESDCYRFDISDHATSELVAVVRIAYEGEAISGGWVIE